MQPRFQSIKTYLTQKPKVKWGVLLAVVFIVLVIGFGFNNEEEKIKHTTAVVTRGDIENLVTATGTLQPRDYVDVGAQVSGQLKVLHVEVGSEVKKGDLLAEIDATVYLAKVDATRAQLRNQRAQLVDRQAQLKLAQVNYSRQQNLQKEDATTLESVESAEASLQSAKAQIDALKAQIEQIESSLRAEEANLEFASIYAPMDGTVVSITSRQGQTLNTNQIAPTLLRIADLSIMTVQAQVSEADVSKLRQDTPVYFTTLGGEGRRWYSTLNQIEPTPVILNNVVLYNALFDVPNPNGLLMTQMTTQVFFVTAQAKDVLLVPMSAIKLNSRRGKNAEQTRTAVSSQRQPKNAIDAENKPGNAMAETPKQQTAIVEVMTAKRKIETREVTVGVTNRILAEITSGLSEGDEVITGVQKTAKPDAENSRSWGGGPRMMR